MTKCQHEGCDKEATHSTTLNIPYSDVPIDLHTPIKVYIDVKFCFDHAKDFGDNFAWGENKPLQEAMDDTMNNLHRVGADYGRSFFNIVKLSDPSYQQFVKFSSERNGNKIN